MKSTSGGQPDWIDTMLRLEIQHRGPVRWYRFEGVADDQSLCARIQQVWSQPDFDTTLAELYDLQRTDVSAVTAAGLRNLASLNARMHADVPPMRVAILIASDLAFGLARMSMVYAHEDRGEKFALFRDEAQAMEWLESASMVP